MSTRTTITEDWTGQQQRDYGPSVWEGTVMVEVRTRAGGEWEAPLDSTAEVLARQAVRHVTHFAPDGEGDPFSPRLVEFGTKGAMHIFTYRVEARYDD